MSIDLTEEEVAAVALLLSSERLAKLHAIAGSTRGAIALHQQMIRLGTSLMSLTAVIEISLRNAICDRLSEHFGVATWLLSPPAPFVWDASERDKIKQAVRSAQRAAYAKMPQADKHALDAIAFPIGVPPAISHDERSNKRQKKINVSTGQVVAQLTLFFWKRLYSDDYQQLLWRTALKRVFPNKSLKRSDVAAHLEKIYQTRNRIAHHEPVYGRRLSDTLMAVDFVLANLGAPGPDAITPIGRLLKDERASVGQLATDFEKRLAELRTAGTTQST